MKPLRYCQEKTSASGSSFTLSFLILPKANREAMTALYAFCREVDDVVDECSDYQVAQTKLNWWKQEIEALYAGTPQHPVTKALMAYIHPFNLPKGHFLEVIDGMEMDIKFNRYQDFKQLQLYCYRVASVVGQLSAQIFGYQQRNTLKYAHDLGIAFQLTNIIRDIGEDARRGRIYLPLDELAQAKVSEDDILKGRETPAFQTLMATQIARAENFYDKALNQLPKQDAKSQRAGLIMAAIYRTLLREIKSEPHVVLNSKVSLPPFRKLTLALAAYFKYG